MGVLTYKGATAEEALGGEAGALVGEWIEAGAIPREAEEGGTLFVESGCQQCHTYRGSGSANLGAPDLTDIGNERDAAYFERYVANPRDFGNQVMPIYGADQGGSLNDEQLQQIGAFLEASKGEGGGG
jgi:mono/diheme cytochrome c family protein